MNAPKPISNYQVAREGEVLGVYDEDSLPKLLRSGELKITDHYWREGMAEWLTLATLMPEMNTPRSKHKFWLPGILVGCLLCVVVILVSGIFSGKPAPSELEELKARAEAGDGKAATSLGLRYMNGDGVKKNVHEAVVWLITGARAGDSQALLLHGNLCLTQSEEATEDIMKELARDQAEVKLRKAANAGNGDAQAVAGSLWLNGERGMPRDEKQAMQWFRAGAEEGHAACQFLLAQCFDAGTGTTKDQVQAVEWFRRSAETGLADAQFKLGHHLFFGCGVAKNSQEGVKWLQRAAAQGHADAQSSLAFCYKQGDGIAKDYVEAYKWANLAQVQESELARGVLNDLEKRMTQSQIAEAQKLSREFKPRIETDR